jgi:hypothetical protein
MTPEITDEVRIAAAYQLMNEAQAAINKATKILDYIMTKKDADYVVQEEICED